jgi:predicted neuraminidase
MKNALVPLLLLTLASCVATASGVDTQLIFPLQSEHVHSSSIIECPNGDLIAVWYQGSGERWADDVRLNGARLRHGQEGWSPVFPMADTPNIPDCNPVLFVDADNRLWLFWIVVQANRWEHSILKYRCAEDYTSDGPPHWAWQDVILLKPGDEFRDVLRKGFRSIAAPEEMWAEYARPYSELLVEAAGEPYKRQTGWMTRARPLQLPTGRILLPLYSDGFNVGLMAVSDDAGQTWRASQPIVGLGPIQPTLARRTNGDIVAYCRDSGGAPNRILTSVSHDQGQSWSLARDSELPNPGSSIALLTLAGGQWVLVHNDTESGRHQLAVSLSEDEGHSWPHKRYLERDATQKGQFAYPTAIEASDGQIHVSYSYSVADGSTIKHAAFPRDWILPADEKQ